MARGKKRMKLNGWKFCRLAKLYKLSRHKLGLMMERNFAYEVTVKEPWATILCDQCQRPKMTTLSLFQLMNNRVPRQCFKCVAKTRWKQNKAMFLQLQEAKGK